LQQQGEGPMMPNPRKLASLSGAFYEELGTAVAGNFLRCAQCGAERHPPPDDMARFFRDGWPECCGETMLLTAHGEVGG
jgi:hypothetical protein